MAHHDQECRDMVPFRLVVCRQDLISKPLVVLLHVVVRPCRHSGCFFICGFAVPFHCKLESVFCEADEIINVSACAGQLHCKLEGFYHILVL